MNYTKLIAIATAATEGSKYFALGWQPSEMLV